MGNLWASCGLRGTIRLTVNNIEQNLFINKLALMYIFYVRQQHEETYKMSKPNCKFIIRLNSLSASIVENILCSVSVMLKFFIQRSLYWEDVLYWGGWGGITEVMNGGEGCFINGGGGGGGVIHQKVENDVVHCAPFELIFSSIFRDIGWAKPLPHKYWDWAIASPFRYPRVMIYSCDHCDHSRKQQPSATTFTKLCLNSLKLCY